MDEKILEILLDLKKEITDIKFEMKKEFRNVHDKIDNVEMKLNTIDNRVIDIDRKLRVTSDQVIRNVETMEDIKIKLKN